MMTVHTTFFVLVRNSTSGNYPIINNILNQLLFLNIKTFWDIVKTTSIQHKLHKDHFILKQSINLDLLWISYLQCYHNCKFLSKITHISFSIIIIRYSCSQRTKCMHCDQENHINSGSLMFYINFYQDGMIIQQIENQKEFSQLNQN